MSGFLIAFMFALGGGTWVYSRAYSRTGGNQKSAIIVAVLSALLLFLLMWIILEFTGNWISDHY